jgi:hypothetical protein
LKTLIQVRLQDAMRRRPTQPQLTQRQARASAFWRLPPKTLAAEEAAGLHRDQHLSNREFTLSAQHSRLAQVSPPWIATKCQSLPTERRKLNAPSACLARSRHSRELRRRKNRSL